MNTNLQLLEPGASEMIESVMLSDIHKDPFDRLFVVPAKRKKAALVTQDEYIVRYDGKTFGIPSSEGL